MIIFFARYIYERLNRVKNTSLYDLLTNLNTRIKGCDINVRCNNLRPYNLFSMFISKFQYHYLLLTHIVYNIITLKTSNEIHLYEMLIINLLTYFSKAERSHDTTSREIVF